jgi:hypothetical protein
VSDNLGNGDDLKSYSLRVAVANSKSKIEIDGQWDQRFQCFLSAIEGQGMEFGVHNEGMVKDRRSLADHKDYNEIIPGLPREFL